MIVRRKVYIIIYLISLSVITSGEKLLELEELKQIANKDENEHFKSVLNGILKPRIVGTQSHEDVKDFIIKELKSLGMNIETDVFKAKPPNFPPLTFTNIIGKLNPDADKFLTLSCHYDSKYYREHYFVGATDSAVPCAIILNILKSLESELKSLKENLNISLMVIFFDGEEAFRQWSAHDSLYGSRHLSQLWDNSTFTTSNCKIIKQIERIDVLILLDLIGASTPKFYNYYENTFSMHKRLNEIEQNMKLMKLHKSFNIMFMNRHGFNSIDDDHRPFLRKNVRVLHLIATPFPKVWHKPEDNEQNLDFNTIHDFNKVLRTFVYEYLKSLEDKNVVRNVC